MMLLTRREGREAASGTVSRPLRILIPFTNPELARAALRVAASLSDDLNAIVTIAAVHLVPYQLPLDCSVAGRDYLARELADLAGTCEVPAHLLVVLARDRNLAFRKLASSGSLVILATRRRWWRTAEEILARVLRRDGCRVFLVTLEAGENGCDEKRLSPERPAESLREAEHDFV